MESNIYQLYLKYCDNMTILLPFYFLEMSSDYLEAFTVGLSHVLHSGISRTLLIVAFSCAL